MYENTNITLDISLSSGEKHTLVFSRDNDARINITIDDKPIDMVLCYKYIDILNNFSKLLDMHIRKLMNS